MLNAERRRVAEFPAVHAEYDDAMDAAASLRHGTTTIDGDEDDGVALPHRPSFQELQKDLAMGWHARDQQRFGNCIEPAMAFRRPADGRRYRSASTASCCPCPSPGIPLEGLRGISLWELRLGKVHSGRVLVGKLCAEAFVVRGVMSVLQDAASPSLAVRISVYNACDEDKQRLLCKGSSIAVKEPFLKRAKDGLLVLRVDNPADIDVLSSSLVRLPSLIRTEAGQLRRMVEAGCCSSSFPPNASRARSRPKSAGNPRNHHELVGYVPSLRSKLLPSQILAGYSDFLLGLAPPPNLPDFVGPVFVRSSSSCSNAGRGLFASSHVKRGGLLLVCNAMAISPDPSAPRHDRDVNRMFAGASREEGLVAKLVRLAMSSQKHLHQMYTLCPSSAASSSMAIPSMGLFTAVASRDERLEIDVSRIRGIVRHNSFRTSMIGGTCITRNITGLWLLPSFINHSCVPNAAWTVVKDAMVVHAASDIAAGQEITMPYFDTLVPLKVRQKFCSNWDFVCACDRCVVEKSVEGAMDNMVRRFRYLYDQAADEYVSVLSNRSRNGPEAAFPACSMVSELYARIREEVDGLEGLTEREKKWVLGSFTHAFAAKYFVEWEAGGEGEGMDGRAAAEALEAGRECEPGSVITVNVAARMYVGAKGWEAGDSGGGGGGRSSNSSGYGSRSGSSSGGGGSRSGSSSSGGGGVELLPLSEELKRDCIAHFGELDTEEEDSLIDKLLRRLADKMPAF